MRVQSSLLCCLVLPCMIAISGCGHSHRHRVVVLNPSGTVAGDFQSIADYLDNSTVKLLLRNMPRNQGSLPPDVEGELESQGEIRATSIPGSRKGDLVTGSFCFGTPSGSRLEVVIQDASVIDAGAGSFIEGSGDEFTVYTAFKSVQTQDIGTTCEIHEVNVISGLRNPDGSISELYTGQGIVGLVGDCGALLVGDVQISKGIADRVGPSCTDDPGAQPGNPSKVLVTVENSLVTDLAVFLDDETTATLFVAPLSTGSFETAPGFSVYFESLQPSAGTDAQGSDLLMGEIVNGQFPTDSTGAGGTVAYAIENQVGTDVFFAPLPVNRKSFDIFAVTNSGVSIPGYPSPPCSGLDCLCSMAPSIDPYVIGYYSYSVPQVIGPTQSSVLFFNVATNAQVDAFAGPFNLDNGSGTVTLLVD